MWLNKTKWPGKPDWQESNDNIEGVGDEIVYKDAPSCKVSAFLKTRLFESTFANCINIQNLKNKLE